jgi:hypothetical protein
MPRKKKETSAKPIRSRKAVSRPKSKAGSPKAKKAPSKPAASRKARVPKALAASKTHAGPHLPRYGETQLVAFVRDPRCVFTYWEVTPEKIQEVKRELKEEFHGSAMVLRVFKVWPQGERQFLFEIEVEPSEMNRYVQIPESVSGHYLEIAQRTRSGRYVVYARSNALGAVPPMVGAASGPFASIAASSSAAMARYYEEQGYRDPSRSLGGPSSAENQKGRSGAYSASPI